MPLSIPPGFATVAIEHRATGDPDPWYIILGIRVFAGDSIAAVDRVLTLYKAFAEPGMGNYVTVTGAEVAVGNDGPPTRFFRNQPTAPWIGDLTVEMLPQNCALLIDKNTELGGRRNQGRIFLPGCLPEGSVSNVGVLTPATVTAWQARADQFMADLDLADPGVIDPPSMYIMHGSGISAIPEPTVVSSLTVQSVISTQRRRLR